MTAKRNTTRPSRFALPLALCLVALPLFAGAGKPADSEQAPARGSDDGEVLFRKTCAACHGQDARGIPGLGKDLMAGTFAREASDAELVAFIERGRPADDPENTTGVPMPAKGGNPALTREDLFAIVSYLRSLQEP